MRERGLRALLERWVLAFTRGDEVSILMTETQAALAPPPAVDEPQPAPERTCRAGDSVSAPDLRAGDVIEWHGGTSTVVRWQPDHGEGRLQHRPSADEQGRVHADHFPAMSRSILVRIAPPPSALATAEVPGVGDRNCDVRCQDPPFCRPEICTARSRAPAPPTAEERTTKLADCAHRAPYVLACRKCSAAVERERDAARAELAALRAAHEETARQRQVACNLIAGVFRAWSGGNELAIQGAVMAASRHDEPHVLMRPQVIQDGNAWLAIYGDLATGVVGTGSSPAAACADFDRAWYADAVKGGTKL